MIKTSAKLSMVNGTIDMSHGAGGRAMTQLIQQLFLQCFDNTYLRQANDGVLLPRSNKRLMMATDSYVVSPLFFPGGNIGELAVNGTINDLAVGGAVPKYLSVGFILEEGFPLSDLKKIVTSMADAAKRSGVFIVTGDTKVVEKNSVDGVFINTTGIGELDDEVTLPQAPQVGDKIIINGDVGDHGVAILAHRENLSFATTIASDTAALSGLIAAMLAAAPGIRCMRDPTRGGVSAVMNEWAEQYHTCFLLNEAAIPTKMAVQSACELMGLDVLHLANEGKVIAVCPHEQIEPLLSVMRAHPLGKKASIIGDVVDEVHPGVLMTSCVGGRRLVDWVSGEPLPRIC